MSSSPPGTPTLPSLLEEPSHPLIPILRDLIEVMRDQTNALRENTLAERERISMDREIVHAVRDLTMALNQAQNVPALTGTSNPRKRKHDQLESEDDLSNVQYTWWNPTKVFTGFRS